MTTETERRVDDAPAAGPDRRVRTVMFVVAALVAGFIGRSIVTDGSDSFLVRWLPFLNRPTVTMFFVDGDYLVPVSRTVARSETGPAALFETLLDGPTGGSGLTNPYPPDTSVTSIDLTDGLLRVDLTGFSAASSLAHEALLQSLRSWPGVDDVAVTVDGSPLDTNSSGHLLYFYDEPRDRLVARQIGLVSPSDVLDAYLEGPSAAGLTGLPADVSSLGVTLDSNGLLRLSFTYRPSLRTYALDHPDSVRRVLEGLIATFTTGFEDVEGVYLDFEGHNALGAGQCANLLNTARLRPEVLNDERLLQRAAEGG